MNYKDEERIRYGVRFVPEEMQADIATPETLQRQTGMSLADRSKEINDRQYPFNKMNPTLLRNIYKKHQVKKKAILHKKVVTPDLAAQLPALKEQLRQELTALRDQGYKIVYIDETMFTRKAMAKLEWAAKHQNAEIDEAQLNEPTKALLTGISESGVEQWKIFPKSVNIKKFQQYLQLVRDAHGDEKVALFMDNLSVHKSKKTKKKMEEL